MEDEEIARREERVRINDAIRAPQVRVIDDESNQLGIMAPADALQEAEERGLDLVEVSPNTSPPVCRIMDYGKYKYQQSKRAKESKKHQHVINIKEVKYRPKIDIHDYNYKTNHARAFLGAGDKVKLTVMFRGREMAHPEFGHKILKRVLDDLGELVQETIDPTRLRREGRTMTIIVSPSKQAIAAATKKAQANAKKTQPKAESTKPEPVKAQPEPETAQPEPETAEADTENT